MILFVRYIVNNELSLYDCKKIQGCSGIPFFLPEKHKTEKTVNPKQYFA